MSKNDLPFLPIAKPDIGSLEKEFVLEAVDSGWVSSVGPYVTEFETRFAEYVGTNHAVSTCNGTDSLFIALKALRIGPGDEVIVPALTFVAVAAAVVQTGAKPCFVDVDLTTWCIDPHSVERALSKDSKAIIAVHSYGHPADMTSLIEIAKTNGLYVLEDCAEAHGAKVNGQNVGSIGHIACFSFYGNKILTTGEGGMITTNDGDLSDRCRYLKDHAMDPGKVYYHSEVGFNSRMTNLQAALGCAQLQRAPEFIEKRRYLLACYVEAFGSTEWVKLNRHCDWADPVVWMVCAVFSGKSTNWRDRCIQALRDANIDSRPFFYPLCDLPPYTQYSQVGRHNSDILIARQLADSGINLPTFVEMSKNDVEFIVSTILDFAAGAGKDLIPDDEVVDIDVD